MRPPKKSAGPQAVWTAVIVLSLVIAVFSVIYASVSSGGPAAAVYTPPSAVPSPGDTALSPSPSGTAASPSPSGAAASPSPSGTAASSSPGGAAASPSPSPTPTPDYSSVILAETADLGDTYVDNFIFLGDSTSYGLLSDGVVGERQVWIPKERYFGLFNQSIIRILDPATQEQLTIEEIFSREKPAYALITLGTDSLAVMSRERFIGDYTALIRRIQAASPDTKLIVNSMYPCTVARSNSGGDSVTMDKINAGNDWIKQVALDTGVPYLDSASALEDTTGYLPDGDTSGDGVHLTADALEQVILYLRTHGYGQDDAA